MELISVIVTIYNGEEYVIDCLKSICNQTYKNLEIIVVDDGSTDNTYDIIKEFSSTDSRIKIIHKENGGVSSARNIGLKYITGKYVSFIDGDDILEFDMYEILVDLINRYQVSMAHCGYKRITPKEERLIHDTKKIYLQSQNEAIECLLGGKLFVGSLWNKLYLKKVFDDIYFDENIKINEDILANYYVLKKIKRSVFYDVAKYNYYARNNCASFKVPEEKKIIDCREVAKRIYIDSIGKDWEKVSKERYLNMLINEYRYHLYVSKNKEKQNSVKKIIKENVKNIKIYNRNLRINIKLISNMPIIYKYIYLIYDKIRKPNWDV